jgi:BlaI family penicillinase repressor
MSTEKNQPTAAELAILQILWEAHPRSVREVHDILSEEKQVVYTTILKTMQLMHQNGLLTRESFGRKHLYSPAVQREEIQDNLLDRFLSRTFGGSTKNMVMRALGNHRATPEEIQELKDFINGMDEDARS